MPPRLIDQIMSIDGLLVGVSYIVAYSVVSLALLGLLDWRERSKIKRRMADIHRSRSNPEDQAGWTP